MKAVLDANVILSLSRRPTTPPNDRVTEAIELRRLQLYADAGGALVGEWERTAKPDVVRQLITHWAQYKGWLLVASVEPLPRRVARSLRRLQFMDAGDRVVLRIAYSVDDTRVVSNDPDFWDPTNVRARGVATAPVARLCLRELGVTVATLWDTVQELSGAIGR